MEWDAGEQGPEDFLRSVHARNAEADVRGPDEHGVFPGSWLDVIFGETFPIVLDTNVLRQDISSACKHSQRGVLISGANSGIFRLFCAEHVVHEVHHHLEEWAERQGLPYQLYVDRWNNDYLPQLHVIRSNGLPLSVLSPAERARIENLPEPKEDLASAVLALSLGALYLTKDKRAWTAVYGRPADSDELYQWLSALQEGGDAGELGRFFHVSTWLTVATVAGLYHAGAWVTRKAPWAWLLAAGAVVLAIKRSSPETGAKLRAGAGRAFTILFRDLYGPYIEKLESFRKRAPAIPTWEELASINSPRDVLARACLYELARVRTGPITAKDLSQRLQHLPVGKSPQPIREVLRANRNCFCEPFAGYWQAGYVADPVKRFPKENDSPDLRRDR